MRKAFRLGLVLLMLLGGSGTAWALESFKTVAMQSAAGATGNGTAIDTANYTSLALQVTITNTATVTFEGTVDGTNWYSAVCTLTSSTSAALVTSAANSGASGAYQCPVAGLAQFRARVSAFTNGTITVTGRVTTAVLGKKGGGAGGSGLTSLEGQTGATQTFTDDTNVTIVSAADAHVITWAGVLAVARGGTGLSSYTAGDMIYATGATTLAKFAKCTDGNVITYASSLPACGTVDAATRALDNLSSVAINAVLIPGTAGALDFGSATKPWAKIYLAGTSGTPGTNNVNLTVAATNPRTITLQDATYTVAGTALAYGGTNQNTWTASRCVQVNSGGTSLEAASAACNSGSSSLVTTPALVQDEFLSGSNANGTVGGIGWRIGAGTVTGVTAVASHPGIINLSSSAVSGTVGRLFAGPNDSASTIGSDIDHLVWIVRPSSGTATMSARFGAVQTLNGSGESAGQGIYFSYLPGTSANWRCITNGGSATANDSAVAYATSTWYQLEIVRSGSDILFKINGSTVCTHSTNLPTTQALSSAAIIETNEAVAKTVDIDYFGYKSIALTRY